MSPAGHGKIVAAAVNPVDFKIRRGWAPQMGPASFPAVPGPEAVGVVDDVGAGITGVPIGDDVMIWADTGSYAKYAPASDFVPRPARRVRGDGRRAAGGRRDLRPCPGRGRSGGDPADPWSRGRGRLPRRPDRRGTLTTPEHR
ncbi:alcohol dehydrogenase catalytic domain-containing protein [Streptomyces griseorubiginosus]|uniref:alcohol dehydrogenase catalytic domain-containing protein n=1 Tax=Streptomyces griseorubiginosus TaxID=67304 RepID=UPI001FCC0916|nr:alcohol dehydrogenase catalytic domain-containing protein [Streptomyces griseorubiginosus]